MTCSRLTLFFAIVAGVLLAASAAEARNEIHVEGTTITVTVPIDVMVTRETEQKWHGRLDALRNESDALSVQLREREALWNQRLSQARYRGCYRVRVVRSGDITLKLENRPMNRHQIKTNWKQSRSKVQNRWPRLTEEDLDQIDGRDTELMGLLQQRYGISKEIAEDEVREFGAGMSSDEQGRRVETSKEGSN